MELRDYLRLLRKRWLSIVIFAVLGVAVAWGITVQSPKIYTATAQDFVAIGTSGTSDNSVLQGSQFTLQRVKSYTEIVSSPQVLGPVIDQLKLDTDIAGLARKVTAGNPLDTVLLEVTASDGNAERAAQLANATAAQLGRVIESLEPTLAGGAPPVKVSVVNPAEVPQAPSSPKRTINLILGLLVGLALGIAWAVVRDVLDNTVKTPQDLAKLTKAAPLGVVGYAPDSRKNPLVALDQTGPRSEAFRGIRTNLQFVDVDNPPRIVVVTSALPEEGKSTTACNLAITVALSGAKVCLLEGDLRRPRVTSYLGIDNAIGLTNVLAGQLSLDSALVSWNRGLLHVLPSGPVPPNPSELLGTRHMKAVLAELRARFDLVIIDAAPVLPVTDAAVLTSLADGSLLVVRHGKTTRDQVTQALAALGLVGGRVLGTVLNFVPTKRSGGYGYGYGYGYTYYGEKPLSRRQRKKRRAERARVARIGADAGTDRSPAQSSDAQSPGTPSSSTPSSSTPSSSTPSSGTPSSSTPSSSTPSSGTPSSGTPSSGRTRDPEAAPTGPPSAPPVSAPSRSGLLRRKSEPPTVPPRF
ncbi:MAG: polysaccharide biosynthesis tyrosine autokinase [Actinomycetota bacterium]|nr:MAG: polysaccharide biosynthesis tyrosine autokinase [Actinomycetota bacterium]